MLLNQESTDSMFRSLLQAAPDGILVCDRQGLIVIASDQCQSLFGYAVAELVGQPIEMLIPRAVAERHQLLREGYFASPRRRAMGSGLELYARHKDGREIPVEISLSPCEMRAQVYVIAVVRDVTEVRRLDRELRHFNQELRRSNEELEQFAYIASHDLKEPLRMVTGYTQLLKRRYAQQLDAEGLEYIDYAVEGVTRMQTLINDLLAFSRLSSKGRVYAAVDLSDVMAQVIANLAVSIAESAVDIEVGGLPTVNGDVTQLTQVLQNLLSNAIKFRDEQRSLKVSIKSERDGAFWRIAVSDNGIGIESQYADRVFVIFQRLHTREHYPGNGIGLAICKKIVERHGGRIWLDSHPGQGSTFYFTLPVIEVTQ